MKQFHFLALFLFFGLFFEARAQVNAVTGTPIQGLIKSSDGKFLITVHDFGGVRIWDAVTNRLIREIDNAGFEGLKLGGCRKVFFVNPEVFGVLGFQELRLYDVNTGKRTGTYQTDQPHGISVSSGGRYSLSKSRGSTEIIDLIDGSTIGKLPIPYNEGMDVSFDGKFLFVPEGGSIACREIKTGKRFFTYEGGSKGKIDKVLLTSDQKFVLGVDYFKTFLWKIGEESIKREFKGETWKTAGPFIAHDRWLILPGALFKEVLIFEIKPEKDKKDDDDDDDDDEDKEQKPVVIELNSPAEAGVPALGTTATKDEMLIAEGNQISTYNFSSKTKNRFSTGIMDIFLSICLSPDETKLYLGTDDGSIKYFDMTTGTYKGIYMSVRKPVKHIKFSKDGREIEIGDGKIIDVYTVGKNEKRESYKDDRVILPRTFVLNESKTMIATVNGGEMLLNYRGKSMRIVTKKGKNRDFFATIELTHLFTGSQAGIEELGLFDNKGLGLTVSQLKTKYYRPNLLLSFFQGVQID